MPSMVEKKRMFLYQRYNSQRRRVFVNLEGLGNLDCPMFKQCLLVDRLVD